MLKGGLIFKEIMVMTQPNVESCLPNGIESVSSPGTGGGFWGSEGLGIT